MARERRPDWWPVARWELLRIVRRPDFILSVVLTPLIAIGMSVGMGALTKGRTHTVAVARVDSAGVVTARGDSALPPLKGIRWLDPGDAAGDTTALAAAVRDKRFEAALVLPASLGGDEPEVHLVTRRDGAFWTRALEPHVAEQRLRERAAAFGLSAAQVTSLGTEPRWRRHVSILETRGDRRGARLVTLVILMLMVTVLLTSISYLMVGISGEKTARVTEVVVSAVSPQAWMDGKILAFTAIGLIVGIVWAGSLLMIAGPMSFALPGSIDASCLLVTLLYATLGLLLYNAFIAALMASAQNMQTASRWQGSFVMLPFLPLAFLGALIDAPDAPWLVVVSHIPFFSPVMLPARMALSAVPAWELALGIVVLAASFWLMRLVAGRVFRTGMLMYGKDMTLPEIIRWARVK
ncbi:MAG: ABC transporter permease [Candidatus Eisenbacteria bacterium]